MSLFALGEMPWFIDPEDESTVYAVDDDGKWWDVRAVIQAMERINARQRDKECNCE